MRVIQNSEHQHLGNGTAILAKRIRRVTTQKASKFNAEKAVAIIV